MSNFDPMAFAMNIIRQHPNIANNPNAKHMIEVLQSGDSVEGQKLAENLCRTYGTSKEQAVQQALQFFGRR